MERKKDTCRYLLNTSVFHPLALGEARVLEFKDFQIHYSYLQCQGVEVVPGGSDCIICRLSVNALFFEPDLSLAAQAAGIPST